MTQPITPNSSLNYTPYDPSLEQSRADAGTGGAGGVEAHARSGAEGAGGLPTAPAAPLEAPEASLCTKELMKAVAACGSAYLSSRVPSPATPLAVLACAASVLDLAECVTADTTVKGP